MTGLILPEDYVSLLTLYFSFKRSVKRYLFKDAIHHVYCHFHLSGNLFSESFLPYICDQFMTCENELYFF